MRSLLQPAPRIRRSRVSSRRGFTLVENMISIAVIAYALAAIYTLNSQCITILRMAKDEAGASQVLQQRVEQLRIANWSEVTDPTWMRDNILNASACGSSTLNNCTETVTVKPYNSANTSINTFSFSPSGATAATANSSLVAATMVEAIWTVSWNGIPNGRNITRQTIVVLGYDGVAKY